MFAPLSLFAGSQQNPLVEAMKLYDQNKFEEAEKILGELIAEKPDDLMINYFYGACRTENQHYGQSEILHLLKGSTGESPLKADYYLGIQYQAQNRWDEALKYYQLFEEECTSEEAEELQLEEKIRQCSEHINPFTPAGEKTQDVAPAAIARPEKTVEEISAAAVYPQEENEDSGLVEITLPDSLEAEEFYEENQPETEPIIRNDKPINFVVSDEFTYLDTTNFRTKEGLTAYLAWEKDQEELDSLTSSLNKLRSDYASARNMMQRNELGQKIIDAENQLLPLQRKVKEQLNASRLAENNYWNNASFQQKDDFAEKLRTLAEEYQSAQKDTVPEIDTSLIVSEVFEDVAPVTPAAPKENKDELTYKIQIGAYSRGLPNYVKKQFDKLSYIRKIENYTDDRGVVVYTTGNLTNLEDAMRMQKQVRQEGIEDAFVVPYFNGKRITLEEAKKIEKNR